MGDSSVRPKDVVFVTGFGPFGNHAVNSSWVAVKQLNETGIDSDNIELHVQEIPVEYEAVKTIIPALWKKHKPKLMVHVGVSGIAKEITLEQQAHNDGYDKFDVKGELPQEQCCVDSSSEQCIQSGLCMGHVCDAINRASAEINVDAVVSNDPGRYLCDFTYYTSLNIDKSRTAFIHVPPLDKPYSGKQLADGLRQAILSMLEQL